MPVDLADGLSYDLAMQGIEANAPILARFFGGWELVLGLATVILLVGRRRLPELRKGLESGIREFFRATREVRDELKELPFDAGKALAGIHGRPANEALTPDNQVGELYDPSAVGEMDAISRKRAARRARAFFRVVFSRDLLSELIGGVVILLLVLVICLLDR